MTLPHVERGSVTVEDLRVEGNASGVNESAAATVTYVYEAKDQGGVTPQPPVVHPPGTGTLPPSGGLANTGLGAGWPLAVAGGAAVLIAAGVFLYGRRRFGGDAG
ncbi:LPXTG cell wall anchor domain-containing protein [Leucobacter luti]|uniref:LPXTG cell wall anchor domain-containing protein n=1 Tax=Leucobacter luti TaxID=340320 RepID=UPI001A9E85F7|nr:LPXTG cell wall anchor domain-containing protein [Leucobacter luti]MCW2288919.1 LPXTG-motif cell wall-anchored protein [Leucobacter luti]